MKYSELTKNAIHEHFIEQVHQCFFEQNTFVKTKKIKFCSVLIAGSMINLVISEN